MDIYEINIDTGFEFTYSMDMKINTLFKHEANTDVAFHPTHIETTNSGIRVKGVWVNIASKNKFVIKEDSFYISSRDLKNWREYEQTKG